MTGNNLIQQEVLSLLPSRRRNTAKWISFNAICCTHNGESPDTRHRGGVLPNPDGSLSYHCFNCGFKTGFYPGRPLSFKFRRWLKWMGADENTIQRLAMEALRIRDLAPVIESAPAEDAPEITYKKRDLPDGAKTFQQWIDEGIIVDDMGQSFIYAHRRLGDRWQDYDLMWTTETSYNLNRRVIIPLKWRGETVGYTARAIDDAIKPKFHTSHEGHMVFNVDRQTPDRQFVILVEGMFDAMAIDALSVMTNEVSEQQAEVIDSLGREVIVVPDWDEPGERMIEAALEYGWSVSFPIWRNDYKDVAEATEHLGSLFVLKSILEGRERNPVKIRLRQKL
jgi:hypothetical protein